MTEGRLADIRRWLQLCGQDTIPTTEWGHVVNELIAAVAEFQTQAGVARARLVGAADLLDMAACAKVLHVAPRTVMKWVDSDLLPATRDLATGNRFVRREDLDAFMKQHGMDPVANALFGSQAE